MKKCWRKFSSLLIRSCFCFTNLWLSSWQFSVFCWFYTARFELQGVRNGSGWYHCTAIGSTIVWWVVVIWATVQIYGRGKDGRRDFWGRKACSTIPLWPASWPEKWKKARWPEAGQWFYLFRVSSRLHTNLFWDFYTVWFEQEPVVPVLL